MENEGMEKVGRLSICATPIGNLEDISYRVLRCLREADVIAAEDTRNSIKLLNHFEIHTPMTAYHEFNKYEKADQLVAQMLAGRHVALVTDAGTPCISDPGEELVKKALDAGVEIESLPGASACITALTLSGLSGRRFCFEAFLPMDKKERRAVLEELAEESRTMILYEAPHRLRQTLVELAEVLGAECRISLCRELTKRHEELERMSLGEAVALYSHKEPRGEYVLVLEGRGLAQKQQDRQQAWQQLSLQEHMAQYLSAGQSEKEAMRQVARDRGMGKREVYQAWKIEGK